jgi:hypothetical protein
MAVLQNLDAEAFHELLLREGVSKRVDFWGRTPLHILAENGPSVDIATARELLFYFPPDLEDGAGRNVFHYIGRYKGSIEFLNEALLHGSENALNANSAGCTPLLLAITHADEESTPRILRLIQSGAGLGRRDIALARQCGNHQLADILTSLGSLSYLCAHRQLRWANRKGFGVLPLDLIWCLRKMLY